MTNFQKITKSPEDLARALVSFICIMNDEGESDKIFWVVPVSISREYFNSNEEAIQCVLDWLNQD